MQYVYDIEEDVNAVLTSFKPTHVLLGTIIAMFVLKRLLSYLNYVRQIGIKSILFHLVVKLPYVRTRYAQEKQKYGAEFWAMFVKQRQDAVKEIPREAIPSTAIEARMKKGEEYCRKCWSDGSRMSGAVYHPEDKHWDFIVNVMRQFIVVNPLHSSEFIPVTQMEAEILRMVCTLYKGDKNTCGLGTSGGTESILLAVLAHREKAKKERNVVYPNIVASNTAHVAIDKAAFYFGIEVRKVPLKKDLKADVAGMKK